MNLIHLHPMLVHFPIALALVALLFDIANYKFKQDWLVKSAVTLTVLATLGALAAILSGLFFTKPTAGLADTLKGVHTLYAIVSTVFLLIASGVGLISFYKNKTLKQMKYVFTAALLLAAIGVSLTGMKGGSIVYDVWLF